MLRKCSVQRLKVEIRFHSVYTFRRPLGLNIAAYGPPHVIQGFGADFPPPFPGDFFPHTPVERPNEILHPRERESPV